jgi:metal-responsive CopG/Arc/MetJ family transcriptional regulator
MSDVQAQDGRKAVLLRLPLDVLDRVDSLAADETISRSAWIRRLIIGVARSTDKVPA